jgi:flagellin-specific chaperone FliS
MWDEGDGMCKKLPDYKSFKKRKFQEHLDKADKIIRGINETSLKSEDKKELIRQLAKKFEL